MLAFFNLCPQQSVRLKITILLNSYGFNKSTSHQLLNLLVCVTLLALYLPKVFPSVALSTTPPQPVDPWEVGLYLAKFFPLRFTKYSYFC